MSISNTSESNIEGSRCTINIIFCAYTDTPGQTTSIEYIRITIKISNSIGRMSIRYTTLSNIKRRRGTINIIFCAYIRTSG